METWIHNEILDGLSKLLCLRLEQTPSVDMIAGTAAMWYEVVTNGKVYDQRLDATRFRAAFVTLGGTRTAWPAPLHFIQAMPPREQLALAKQPIKADPLRAERAMSELAGILNIDRKMAAAGGDR